MLSDFDICKALACIEHGEDWWWKLDKVYIKKNGVTVDFNPIEDDGLCFQLMKKHSICLDTDPTDGGLPEAWSNVMALKNRNENPNKAICLLIIDGHS